MTLVPMRLLLQALTAILVLAVAGPISLAAAAQPDATPVVASPQLPVTVQDVNGDDVTVTDASRIVPLSGDIAEIVYALGLGDHIVGTDVSAVYPPGAFDALPKIGFERNLSAEGILSLEPTVVIGKEAAGPPPVLEQIRAAGVPVVIIPEAQTLDGVAAKIRSVAAALGVDEAGETLASQTQAEIDAALELASQATSQPRVMFIYVRDGGTQLVGGEGVVSNVMIEAAGGIDAGADTGVTGFVPVTAEAIAAAQPDIIIAPSSGVASIGGVEALLEIPGVAQTPAGQDERILVYDDLRLLGLTPRTGEMLMELTQAIHPELPAATPVASPAQAEG